MNVALILSYLGTRYHGWQRQENAMTIQQLIEDAIARVSGCRTYVSGVGRTDAGVHARTYVANCKLQTTIPIDRLPEAVNTALPHDVSIRRAVVVPDAFDARFDCVYKEYTYEIHNNRTRNPFYDGRAYFYPKKLDLEKMQRAAAHFAGRKDFAAVRNLGTPVKSTVREVFYVRVEKEGDLFRVKACADGFLYNMVRSIAGTLVYCGAGKIDPDDIPGILASGQRELAGPTLPPDGLYMTRLHYHLEALNDCLEQE